MNPQDQQKGLSDIVSRLGLSLDEQTAKRQSAVYKRLRSLLNNPKYSLDVDKNGNIKTTGANLRKVVQVLAILKTAYLTDEYKALIERFSKAYQRVENHANKWFKGIGVNFKEKPVYKDVKAQAVEDTLRSINPEGFREALEIPIKNVLKEYVRSGRTLAQLNTELEKGILGVKNKEGDKVLRGYLDNYHWRKRITRDAIFQYSRNYDDIVSRDLGLEWYYYSGSLVDDSRDFCEARAGKYFHIKEIESWADLKWQGKAAGTTRANIKSQLGGYSCKHTLRPVSLRLVPESDIERARRLGFIDEPEQDQKG